MERRDSGFTLGELLTTLAVAGIALSLAIPGLNAAIAGQRRATAINEFVGALNLARSTAILRNLRVTVCPSSDGAHCAAGDWAQGWIAFADPHGTLENPVGKEPLAIGHGDAGLSISSAVFDRFIAYRPGGQATTGRAGSESGEFAICDRRSGTNGRTLRINASGQPRLGDQQADGHAPRCHAG